MARKKWKNRAESSDIADFSVKLLDEAFIIYEEYTATGRKGLCKEFANRYSFTHDKVTILMSALKFKYEMRKKGII